MPCLAEQSPAGWELQEQCLREGNSLVLDIRCKGGRAMGSCMSNNKENCLARALAPAESLALSQEKWVGGTRYQLHNSQRHMEAGQQGWAGTAGQGEQREVTCCWRWRVATMREMAGDRPKEDNGRIYEHSDNESQLSVTILNLVRGRMRGAVSSGQVGRFNAAVPQRNRKISPPTLAAAPAFRAG